MKCNIKGEIKKLNMTLNDISIEGELTVSDSYHTFEELYTHRIMLFITLMKCKKDISWKSKLHHDGTSFDDWFIAGMNLPSGTITYHVPNNFWGLLEDICTLEKSPPWDGHTGDDVIRRLNNYCYSI